MVEVLSVVAMIIIMGGLVVMSISQWQKNLYQLEMDGTAKEIYIASQNHLTSALEQGFLEQLSPEADELGNSAGGTNEYYFEVNPTNASTYYSNNANALALMLPLGSIDDTVRLGGSYVICYEYNKDAGIARVLDVYYGNPHGRYPATISVGGSYTSFKTAYSGADKSGARLAYTNADKSKGIIGWYGGELGVSLALPSGELNPPTISVENAERLRVTITDNNMLDTTKADLKANLRLMITGATSKAQTWVNLSQEGSSTGSASSNPVYDDFKYGIYVIDLDDITGTGCPVNGAGAGHFADLPSKTAEEFIPGEDLYIQAIASTNSALAADASSNIVTENSLFNSIVDDITVDDDGNTIMRKVAVVSSMRHLENLGSAVSKYSELELTKGMNGGTTNSLSASGTPDAQLDGTANESQTPDTQPVGAPDLLQAAGDVVVQDGGITVPPMAGAMQINDLSWTRFLNAVVDDEYDEVTGTRKTEGRMTLQEADGRNAEMGEKASQIAITASGSGDDLSVQGAFVPVTLGAEDIAGGYTLDYDGKTFRIFDVVVRNGDASGNAGLFGTLSGGSVKDVELVRFDVAPNGDETGDLPAIANAGALAGSMSGTTVSGVVAHNHLAKDADDSAVDGSAENADDSATDGTTENADDSASDDSALEINGSGDVGGLVGNMSGGSITASAAALYVKSTGGSAGGLVGSASETKIKNSYSGGHTVNGAYSTSRDGGTAGRINVQGSADDAAVGGLVGVASNTEVANCYSTCSAYGVTAGGLVGIASDGSAFDNCYATGLVRGTTAGVFAGSLSDVAPKDCYYLDYLDNLDDPDIKAEENSNKDEFGAEKRPAIGDEKDSKLIKQIDESTASYQKYVNGTGSAICYDPLLKQRNGGAYPFKDIYDLAGEGSLKTHYGDWPSPGALVVNKQEA